ncbi:alpha/beta-hydrolase [Byssothecium circinans]|uniref:Alpha/beta-hydrolase n=1 Tax=Byssothecium circinans TaxID=147558 RepID=A0A6A5U2W4_9PLEO|nr:alpha/beta-hydrolase [Byssothecium circinans]
MTRGGNTRTPIIRDNPLINPNALHDFHTAKRGPKNIPDKISAMAASPPAPKDPGHPHAQTTHISFEYFDQRKSNAPFGYEHYVSLPPDYDSSSEKKWPVILFLHGAGESQRRPNESYVTLRHGIPKLILAYDKLKSGIDPPSIDIPIAERLRKGLKKQNQQGDNSSKLVDPKVCSFVAENFITVTPSLNMEYGYGWNSSILSALLDEIQERYRVDVERVCVTGFSMGGYGTWDLGMHEPERFSCLVPICGGGDNIRASLIKSVPHWIFHGGLDDIIPLRASQQMVNALKKYGAKEEDVNFTKYPDLMHDSWTRAYGDIELFEWILEKRKR